MLSSEGGATAALVSRELTLSRRGLTPLLLGALAWAAVAGETAADFVIFDAAGHF